MRGDEPAVRHLRGEHLRVRPGVDRVAAVPHPRWGEGVGAWVVVRPGTAVSEHELVEHCRTRLAGFKKPVVLTFVAALPRSSTGKLLRRRLRDDRP